MITCVHKVTISLIVNCHIEFLRVKTQQRALLVISSTRLLLELLLMGVATIAVQAKLQKASLLKLKLDTTRVNVLLRRLDLCRDSKCS